MENVKKTQKPFRVLALDGGGIRGLYTATLLKILTNFFSQQTGQESKKSFGEKFDLIAGTSTGGILAVGLANGIPLDDIIGLYLEAGASIFPQENCFPGLEKKWPILRWLWKFSKKPSAEQQILQKRLANMLGDSTLGDVYKKHSIALCLPCVDAKTHEATVLKTPHASYIVRDGLRKAVDVCLATSAAPIYFPMAALPSVETAGVDVFVDGGLWANNPVLVGLVEALSLVKEDQAIEIVSVGTCAPPEGESYSADECDRGLIDWHVGIRALNLSLDAQASGHAFIAEKLSHHVRVPSKIIRLHSDPPPHSDAVHIGLDKAYTKAYEALQSRAVADAKVIQSRYTNGDLDMKLLCSILG